MKNNHFKKINFDLAKELCSNSPNKIDNGYDNPYCRVWTYHHQYNQLERAIRPFDLQSAEMLEKGDDKIKTMHFRKVYEAAKDVSDTKENYYAVFNEIAYGKSLLIFNPNDTVLKAMKPYLEKSIMLKIFYGK